MYDVAQNRTNLNVFAFTQDTQIMFNENKTAIGVMAQGTDNKTFPLMASRDVVSCAGIFRSPQLLMVSGIGGAYLLRKNNITVVADRPGVGQNLQDQSFVGITYEVNFNTTSQIFNSQFSDFVNYTLFPQKLGVLTDAVDLAVFENVPPESTTLFRLAPRQLLFSTPPIGQSTSTSLSTVIFSFSVPSSQSRQQIQLLHPITVHSHVRYRRHSPEEAFP
jgi:choline dehydrogenase